MSHARPKMDYEDLEDWIRTENGTHGSVEGQAFVAKWLCKQRYTIPDDREIRRRALDDKIGVRVEHSIETILENLEDIEVVEKITPSGDGQYIQHERSNTLFFDPTDGRIPEYLEEEISRFKKDLHEQAPHGRANL